MTDPDIKLSKNFWKSEFGGVNPNADLLRILQAIRDEVKKPIVITSSTRELADHIRIYKELDEAGKLSKPWYEAMPLASRHLPTFKTHKLRAVDFKILKGKKNGKKIYFTGEYLKKLVYQFKENICVGVGIGKEYLHLDVDRKSDTVWRYDY